MLKRGRNRGFYAICCPMEAFRIFSNPGKYGAFVGVGERVALRRDAVALAAQFAFEHRHDVAGLFLVACCVFIAPRILARENPSSNLFLPPLRNGNHRRCVVGGGFLHFYGMVVPGFMVVPASFQMDRLGGWSRRTGSRRRDGGADNGHDVVQPHLLRRGSMSPLL